MVHSMRTSSPQVRDALSKCTMSSCGSLEEDSSGFMAEELPVLWGVRSGSPIGTAEGELPDLRGEQG